MKKLTASILILIMGAYSTVSAHERHNPSYLRLLGRMVWIVGKFRLGYHAVQCGLESAYVMQETKNAQVHYHTLVHDAQDMHQLIRDCFQTDDIGVQYPTASHNTKIKSAVFDWMHQYIAQMGLSLIGIGCYLMVDGVLDSITLIRDLYSNLKSKKKKLPKIKIINT